MGCEYDPVAQVWNKFDGKTGEVTDISTAIGYPIFEETYDKPNPAPAYGMLVGLLMVIMS